MNAPPESELDRAILANRECPCEAHEQAVKRAMEARTTQFYNGQTREFQRRTH